MYTPSERPIDIYAGTIRRRDSSSPKQAIRREGIGSIGSLVTHLSHAALRVAELTLSLAGYFTALISSQGNIYLVTFQQRCCTAVSGELDITFGTAGRHQQLSHSLTFSLTVLNETMAKIDRKHDMTMIIRHSLLLFAGTR